MDEITDYSQAYDWLKEGCSLTDPTPSLLLGNGFSMAHDPDIFSYRALRSRAEDDGLISQTAGRFFDALDTFDFEMVIKSLLDSARSLRILRNDKNDPEAASLDSEAANLKDALARTLAGLHPSRPHAISVEAFDRVYGFISQFYKIYTVNYDMLLYWTIMHGSEAATSSSFRADDGFRDPGSMEPFVAWDHLHSSRSQTVFYIHGALHLFRGGGLLRKLTWIRTSEALLDQIRRELDSGRFPLYVAEGSSAEKLDRIGSSTYLNKGLASIAQTSNRGLLTYGLSFSDNDEHINKAIVESSVNRLAISLYGDPSSSANLSMLETIQTLVYRRELYRKDRSRTPSLEIQYFDATSVTLWH